MKLEKRIAKQQQRRVYRIRNRVRKVAPNGVRLSVFRSNKHIYVQIINDVDGVTVAAASSREAGICGDESGSNQTAAAKVGKAIAERALKKGIKQVALDRGPYRYHGRIAALANAAREVGLEF